MAQATRNQILLATLFILALLSGLTVFLALKQVIPDAIQTYLFVVLGDMSVGIVLYKLLAEEKAQLDITTVRDLDRIGFQLRTKRKSLHRPRVILNGKKYDLEEVGVQHNTEIDLMYVDTNYVFYPYRLEAQWGSGWWVNFKVFGRDDNNNPVMVGEMEIDVEKSKQVRTNATAIVQDLRFNSEELEEERHLQLGFVLRAGYTQRREGVSPNDIVRVFLKEIGAKKPRWKRWLRL